MAVKVNFQNGVRCHLEFTSGFDFFRMDVFGQWLVMFLRNFMNRDLPHPAPKLLRSVKKFKMTAVGHLELFLVTLDHTRSLLVDRKLVFKFCVDRIYISEDISDRTFRKFGLKRLSTPPKFTF